MVKLLIDDQAVAIDSDFNTDIIRENPLITSTGDYSYDIDVDLRVPQNRRIYREFQRLNTLSSFSQRKAVLLDNEKILARGAEAVLSIEENRAKIQVLSNNSELNYICDNKQSIRDLDFGTVETKTLELAAKVSGHLYGEVVDGIAVREAYPLVSREDFGGYGSNASFFNGLQGGAGATRIAFSDVDNLRPMPYLLYYVDKLVEILGYSMGTCHIDRAKYKRLLVIHGYDTLEYAKMLPNWTVSEFISEVEKFFGVVFLVDSVGQKIDIVSVDSYYEGAGYEYIDRDDVLDEHEVNFEPGEEDFQTSYQNVGYKLPSSEYWKLAAIDEEVDKRCERVNKSFYTVEEYDPKSLVIFYDHRRKEEWIHYEEEGGGENSQYARFVNFFAPVVKDASVSRTELAITPVKMQCSYRVADIGGYMFVVPIPEYFENKGATLSDAIRGETMDNASDRMQVAFYLGFCHFREISGERSPFSFGTTQCVTTRYLQLYNVDWQFTSDDEEDVALKLNLELKGEEGRCATELNAGVFIDGTRQFKIRFKTNKFLDPRKKFVIANRLLYCQQLRYKLEQGKISDIVEGVFYPSLAVVNSSEEQSQIILPDGIQVYEARVYLHTIEASGGMSLGTYSSLDNGYSENDFNKSRYADNERAQHFRVVGMLYASSNMRYTLSNGKVTKYVNGELAFVNTDPVMEATPPSLPSEMLCDTLYLSDLTVGDTITYLMETDHQAGHLFGLVELKVVS